MAARHEEIAEELRRAIDREDCTVGSPLPAETEPAGYSGVARGTVRQAVAALTAEGLIGSRQGARRVVLAGRHSQSSAERKLDARCRLSAKCPGPGLVVRVWCAELACADMG